MDISSVFPLKKIINDFQDVQCNIIQAHGRKYVCCVLLHFRKGNKAGIRSWIRSALSPLLVSASEYALHHSVRKERLERCLINVLLTKEAYTYLNRPMPPDSSFGKGMHARPLNDPSVESWDIPYSCPEQLHAMIVIAHDQAETIRTCLDTVSIPSSVTVLGIENGNELPGCKEHFGYVDGISQPIYVEEDVDHYTARYNGKLLWNPATPLTTLLVTDPNGQTKRSYGSYLVYRKLEQDVKQFVSNIRELSEKLQLPEEYVEAMVVGRFKDGTPLIENSGPGEGPSNNFNFDKDGAGTLCPYHAHIRKVNPRGQHDKLAESPDEKQRIARRGIPYGQHPESESVGLLFMCYQSNINKQFELIQINWSNFGDFGVIGAGTDPVSGQRNIWERSKPNKWPAKRGEKAFIDHLWTSCVRMCGGAYFFAPSLSFLKNI